MNAALVLHCVKNVEIRVFSGLYFPVFGLNMEIYSKNLLIQFEYRKIQARKKSVFGHLSRSANLQDTRNTKALSISPELSKESKTLQSSNSRTPTIALQRQ